MPTRWAWPSRCATTCSTSRPAPRRWARPRARTWPRPSPPTPRCLAWTAPAPSSDSWRRKCARRWRRSTATAACCRRWASWRYAATTDASAMRRKAKGPVIAGPFAYPPAVSCLLHQAQGEGITVGDALVGLDRGHDGQHQPGQEQQQPDRDGQDRAEAEGDEGQDRQRHADQGQGDVEVQRFLGLVGGEGHGVLLDQPDDQRA